MAPPRRREGGLRHWTPQPAGHQHGSPLGLVTSPRVLHLTLTGILFLVLETSLFLWICLGRLDGPATLDIPKPKSSSCQNVSYTATLVAAYEHRVSLYHELWHTLTMCGAASRFMPKVLRGLDRCAPA